MAPRASHAGAARRGSPPLTGFLCRLRSPPVGQPRDVGYLAQHQLFDQVSPAVPSSAPQPVTSPPLSWALTPKGSRGHSSLVCRPLVLLPVQTLLSSQQQARPPGLRGWARPSPLLSFLPGTHVLEDFGHRTRPAFSYQSHPRSVPSLGVPEGWARGSGHTTWSSSYFSRIPTMSSGASQLLCTPGAGLL